MCVLGGGFKNNYPKPFNVLPFFFFFFGFSYTILSSDLRPPLGPRPLGGFKFSVPCDEC